MPPGTARVRPLSQGSRQFALCGTLISALPSADFTGTTENSALPLKPAYLPVPPVNVWTPAVRPSTTRVS